MAVMAMQLRVLPPKKKAPGAGAFSYVQNKP